MLLLLIEATATAIPTATSHIEVEMVTAWTSTSTCTSTATTTTTPEEVFEDVIEVHVVELLTAPRLSIPLFVLSDSLFALLVVDASLLFVREDFIGIGNLLELFFRSLWIVLIFVRVVLNCEFLEGLFDLCIRGVTLHSQSFIEVFSGGLLLLTGTLSGD